jgi:hypothetical protein
VGKIERHDSGILVFSDIRDFEEFKQIKKDGKKISTRFSFIVPELPKWCDHTYHYKEIKINPYQLKCSCNDSILRRKYFESRDIRVTCKHLYWKIAQTKIKEEVDELVILLMKQTALFGTNKFLTLNVDNAQIHLGFRNGNDWITILTPLQNGGWRSWGYNPFEGRWSYDEEPKNRLHIELEISRYFSNWKWLEKEK